MKRRIIMMIIFALAFAMLLSSCAPYKSVYDHSGDRWCIGFGSSEIEIPKDSDEPLYIAGYNNGKEIEGVLDIPLAKALWIDNGEGGILLIGIDCVGLGSRTVGEIRKELSHFSRKAGCVSVNVYATHSHAGIDTLGLWGPVAVDGKNDCYMDSLVDAAVDAARAAYDDRSSGTLYYGAAEPKNLLYDSREPIEYDPMLHQIRFAPDDSGRNGIRLISYAAHAESLRGDNLLVSADFPGEISRLIYSACGDDVMYMPAAIGGLIMTRELSEPFDAEENMRLTAKRLFFSVMSISNEEELSPSLAISSVDVSIPLDNTYFFFAKFLGILGNDIKRGKSETGYLLESEVGALRLGSVTLALIPGEIFPELVSGNGLSKEDPEALSSIAKRYGADKLLVLGLCNDELGYIVPRSNYMLNEDIPYIETVTDENGENHYEETNSVSIMMAEIIANAFEEALSKLQ
jgi:hypothetical protein